MPVVFPSYIEGAFHVKSRVLLRFDLILLLVFTASLVISGIRAFGLTDQGFVILSMKFDLRLLDYKMRFSLWQVKMRAILE